MYSQLFNKVFSLAPKNYNFKLKAAFLFLILTFMFIFSLIQNVWITTDPDYYRDNINVPLYDQIMLVPFFASLIQFESDISFYIKLGVGIALMLLLGFYITKHADEV